MLQASFKGQKTKDLYVTVFLCRSGHHYIDTKKIKLLPGNRCPLHGKQVCMLPRYGKREHKRVDTSDQ